MKMHSRVFAQRIGDCHCDLVAVVDFDGGSHPDAIEALGGAGDAGKQSGASLHHVHREMLHTAVVNGRNQKRWDHERATDSGWGLHGQRAVDKVREGIV